MCDESFFDHEGLARYCDILGSLLQARYSCRGFLPDSAPRPVIERILGLAQRTASWCNAQPWQVVIASERATTRLREELIEHIRIVRPKPDFAWPSAYHGVYQARRRECGLQLYKSVGVARGDTQATEQQRLENFRFFGAPQCSDHYHGSRTWHLRGYRLRRLRREFRTCGPFAWRRGDRASRTGRLSNILARASPPWRGTTGGVRYFAGP
jgi:nitroreductase